MATFIANRIIEQGEISIATGQEKYRQYFIKTSLYLKYKASVDVILTTDGWDNLIVTE